MIAHEGVLFFLPSKISYSDTHGFKFPVMRNRLDVVNGCVGFVNYSLNQNHFALKVMWLVSCSHELYPILNH